MVLENIGRLNFKNEDLGKLMKLYKYNGKHFYYDNILSSDVPYIKKKIVVKDTYSIKKILNLDINDNRLRLLINKNSKAKNKEEQLIKNVKEVLTIGSEKGFDFELISNEVLSMAEKLFANIKRIKFATRDVEEYDNLLVVTKTVSKRDEMDHLFEVYRSLLSTEMHESVSLIVNFYIDFINIKPFTSDNEFIGLFLIQSLLLRERFDINLYQSFFDFIGNNYAEFNKLVAEANYNYRDGYSHTEGLTDLIIKGLIKNYDNLEKFIRDYQYDNKLNKSDNIENTIFKLSQTFTKEDIRAKHPYVSDSTINRTLQRLRDEGKIAPLGTGRSASWIRVTEAPERFNPNGQLDIFGVGLLDDED